MPDNNILTTAEVAQILTLTERAVTRKFMSGQIPAFKLQGLRGEEWRCYRQELDKYISQNENGQGRETERNSVSLRQTEEQRRLLSAFAELPDSIDSLRCAITEAPDRLVQGLSATVGEAMQQRIDISARDQELDEARSVINRLEAEIAESKGHIEQLERELEKERRQTWWDRLLGR